MEIGEGAADFFEVMPIAGENLQVTLTTTSLDPPGCIQSITKPVKVAEIPIAIFDADSGCLYNPFEFISESINLRN